MFHPFNINVCKRKFYKTNLYIIKNLLYNYKGIIYMEEDYGKY